MKKTLISLVFALSPQFANATDDQGSMPSPQTQNVISCQFLGSAIQELRGQRDEIIQQTEETYMFLDGADAEQDITELNEELDILENKEDILNKKIARKHDAYQDCNSADDAPTLAA